MVEYFGVSVLVVALGTGFGILLKKICPPLFAVLNGGRRENENLFYSCASRQNRSEPTENFCGMDDGIKIVHVKDFLSGEWL